MRTDVEIEKPSLLRARVCGVLLAIALIVLTTVVFSSSFKFLFINYHDPGYVTDNPHVSGGLSWPGVDWAFRGGHAGNWHPITSISHMLDVQLFGLNPGMHHLMNVLLHTAAVVLLFLVLWQMTSSAKGKPTAVAALDERRSQGHNSIPSAVIDRRYNIWRSAFVAALFAIHPLRVESVVWISERKDVLSGVFFMLTLAAYARFAAKPSVWRYALVACLFALGLASKPSLIGLPLVFLLLDYWPLGRMQRANGQEQRGEGQEERARSRKRFGRLIVEKVPLLVLSLGSCLLTIHSAGHALASMEPMPLSWRLGNALVSYVIYLRQTVWPVGLAVFYPHPENHLPIWQVPIAGLLLVAVTAFVFAKRRQFPYLLTGWLWYVIMLVPVIGIVQVEVQGHADRYTYLPQIGLFIGFTWAAADLLMRWPSPIKAFAAVAIVMSLGWQCRVQTSYWRESEALWRHTLAATTNNDVAHTNLAEILLRQGRAGEALFQSEQAIKIAPNNAQAYYDLGLSLLSSGQPADVLDCLRKSVALQPQEVNAAALLAWITATCPDASLRNGSEAVRIAERVRNQTEGPSPELLHALAAAYAETNQFDKAIRTGEEALQLANEQHKKRLASELELNLKNYRQGLPVRDSSLTNTSGNP